MVIYLAGTVTNDKWRKNLIDLILSEVNIIIDEFIDPAIVEKSIFGKLVDKSSGFCPVTLNLNLIKQSDLLIAFFKPDHQPIGTSCELFFAYQNHIPSISIVPENLFCHPWIHQLSTLVLKLNIENFDNPDFSPIKNPLTTFINNFKIKNKK